MLARSVDDVYGAALSCWQFIQQRDAGCPKVRVFNPDYENHGWQSMHTVIEVVFEDMPFLVDSVRMQLNARQMSLHAIHYCMLNAERSGSGALNVSKTWNKNSKTSVKEAIIYIEVDHHSDTALLDTVTQELIAVLSEVKSCVRDFPAIVAKAKAAAHDIGKTSNHHDKEECAEAEAFLLWLVNNHFTFLAYDEFCIETEKKERYVVRDSANDLGIFKLGSI